jgi:hypothetical protein
MRPHADLPLDDQFELKSALKDGTVYCEGRMLPARHERAKVFIAGIERKSIIKI